MSFESDDFYRYITDKTAKEELENNNKLALNVSKIMFDIRKQCDIKFDL